MKNVIIAILIALLLMPVALCNVSPVGHDDQKQINAAIGSGGKTVVLNPGIYKISGPIVLKSGTVLKGSGDSTVIYASSGVCNSDSSPAYIYGYNVKNVEVSNLQFQSSAKGTGDGGHGDYRNCIRLRNCNNVKIHDVLFKNYLYCDGVRDSSSSNVLVYNCRINAGHDGICFYNTKNSKIFNNDIQVRTNTGTRIYGASNVEIYRNTYYGSYGSGWCTLELEGYFNNINIHNNILGPYKGSSGSYAVAPVKARGSASIHDNVLISIGKIGYGSSKNNIINQSDKSISGWVKKGYGSSLSK
jgi:parallel beta-helix repeat protein